MAILVDLQQVMISNLMVQVGFKNATLISEDLIRHMVLNSLRSYQRHYKARYGELIICCDSRRSWRKDFFPFYKSNRKKDREESVLDWKLIFESFEKLRDELKNNFPYRVIEVAGAEADDIIGLLAARLAQHEDVLILSTDKDFLQLQKYPRITQYSPLLKKFITSDDPKMFLKEHILRGDRGDGVPNFLSPDATLATGERQRVLSQRNMTDWLAKAPSEFCTNEVMLRGYKRNETLIDLEYTPDDIKTKIVDEFEQEPKKVTKNELLNYFMKHRLKNLMENLSEF